MRKNLNEKNLGAGTLHTSHSQMIDAFHRARRPSAAFARTSTKHIRGNNQSLKPIAGKLNQNTFQHAITFTSLVALNQTCETVLEKT